MGEMRFAIAYDFSKYPGGRLRRSGPNSGEELRQDYLVQLLREAIDKQTTLVVTIDDTAGYGASFLEEAFGGLIREDGFSTAELSLALRIEANVTAFKPYKILAERYIEEAGRKAARSGYVER